MSGKAGPSEGASLDGDRADHGNAVVEGVSTAVSWLTVVPVRGASVFDRITGRRALAAAPVAGLVPGLAAVVVVLAVSGASWFLSGGAGTPPPWLTGLADAGGTGFSPAATGAAAATSPLLAMLAGVLVVCAAELSTRAMHVDGLADVADALGSYRDPEGAREILRSSDTGPMGAGAVSLTLVAQAAAFAVLAHRFAAALFPDALVSGAGAGPDPVHVAAAGTALVLPFVIGRAAATTACHTSLPPMAPTGFGGLAAATQSTATVVAWWVPLTAVSGIVAGIAGAVACMAVAAFASRFGALAVKRLGGVNGDVLGGAIQVGTLIAASLFALA